MGMVDHELQVNMVDPPPLRPEAREWMPWREAESREPIKVRSSTRNPREESGCSVMFGRLTPREFDALQAFLIGKKYLGCFNGRLYGYDVHEPLPDPVDDPLMSRHWPQGERKEFGGIPSGEGWHHSGITLTAVGVGGRPNEPQRSYRMLTECGFACLRSPRGADGKHWEQWVLHSLAFAKGLLREHMKKHRDTHESNWHKDVEEAARFIARDLNVSFGSLDITIQRWALACPD